jgi:HSP20 family protein
MNNLVKSNRPPWITPQFIQWANNGPSHHRALVPAANVMEDKTKAIIEIPFPGRTKEDLEISVDQDVLTVKTKNIETKVEENKNTLRQEWKLASFSRSWNLSDKISKESISAKMENGVLSLELPFQPEAVKQEPKTISIS